MKTAIVFGGAGFVGSHLLKFLASTGEYDRLISADIAAPRFAVDGVDYQHADVREAITLEAGGGHKEIFNLAAVHTTPGHEDWEYYWTNVRGAANICRFAQVIGCDSIVFTSSISVYGPSEQELDENSPLHPISAYGKSKLCAEDIHRLWQAAAPERRRLVVARPAVIYGLAERGNFTRLARLLAKGRFVFPGRDDTIKSAGYVKDLVRSFIFALDQPLNTLTYNFAHQERLTSKQICEAFGKVASYRIPSTVIPLGLLLTAALPFEVVHALGFRNSINRPRVMKLVNSTNILPTRLRELGFKYDYTLETSLADWRSMSPSGSFD